MISRDAPLLKTGPGEGGGSVPCANPLPAPSLPGQESPRVDSETIVRSDWRSSWRGGLRFIRGAQRVWQDEEDSKGCTGRFWLEEFPRGAAEDSSFHLEHGEWRGVRVAMETGTPGWIGFQKAKCGPEPHYAWKATLVSDLLKANPRSQILCASSLEEGSAETIRWARAPAFACSPPLPMIVWAANLTL
ncbi:uncharacterized protein VTP21DRAFT_6108 [Calcarisporiella thermophila]|uniref:uncharacterized protein n=1 Tax=Calcarisporiella thermophila TaxID=911321 RepID=UPI00374225E4